MKNIPAEIILLIFLAIYIVVKLLNIFLGTPNGIATIALSILVIILVTILIKRSKMFNKLKKEILEKLEYQMSDGVYTDSLLEDTVNRAISWRHREEYPYDIIEEVKEAVIKELHYKTLPQK